MSNTATQVTTHGASAREADIRQEESEIASIRSSQSGSQAQLDQFKQQYAALQAAPVSATQ